MAELKERLEQAIELREPLDSGTIRIFHQRELIAEHHIIDFAWGDGDRSDSLCNPAAEIAPPGLEHTAAIVELTPSPGVGLYYCFTRPYTPRTDGKADRFIQAALANRLTPATIRTPTNAATSCVG